MPLIANPAGQATGPMNMKVAAPAKASTPVKAVKTVGGPNPGGLANPQNSAPGGKPGGGSSIAPQLDATALANIASYLNKTGLTIGNDQTGITNNQTQLSNALAQDQQANKLADLKMMTGANAHGGLYGSAYGQQLGNENTAYGLKEGAATSTANSNVAKLTSAISELQQSEPIYASQQANAATARAAAAAAKYAPASTKPLRSVASRAAKPKTVVRGGPNPGGLANPLNNAV